MARMYPSIHVWYTVRLSWLAAVVGFLASQVLLSIGAVLTGIALTALLQLSSLGPRLDLDTRGGGSLFHRRLWQGHANAGLR